MMQFILRNSHDVTHNTLLMVTDGLLLLFLFSWRAETWIWNDRLPVTDDVCTVALERCIVVTCRSVDQNDRIILRLSYKASDAHIYMTARPAYGHVSKVV